MSSTTGGVRRRRSTVIDTPPRGWRYVPDFIDAREEAALIAHIEQLSFAPFRYHGIDARREVAHFGARYGFDDGTLDRAAPLPTFLLALCARIQSRYPFAAPAARIAALVTRYPPGAGIGWHRDAPPFGPTVVGLSLAAACEFRLRLETATGFDVYKTTLAPRSLYLIAGPVRFRWQHAMTPVSHLRYSVTFRTVKE